MSAQHTPGPWLLDGRTVYALNKRLTNRFSLHVQLGRPDDGGWISEDEAKANTRLIAAAPDLLAALTGILNHYSEIGSRFDPQMIAARAAIAAATGDA